MVDSPFGQVRLSYNKWPAILVVVQGPGMPEVRVVPGREFGSMGVNGQRVEVVRGAFAADGAPDSALTPARDAISRLDLRRAAARVRVNVLDSQYDLRPDGLRHARLLRNGQLIARARGTLAAYLPWADLPGINARVTWQPGVDPADVAIGQAMVAGFGAGAPGVLLNLLRFWSSFPTS